jgi:hypothetical protein
MNYLRKVFILLSCISFLTTPVFAGDNIVRLNFSMNFGESPKIGLQFQSISLNLPHQVAQQSMELDLTALSSLSQNKDSPQKSLPERIGTAVATQFLIQGAVIGGAALGLYLVSKDI